ncbi:unnamed protein product, partial [Plutella xylostella]
MIDDFTNRCNSACSNTRVDAALVIASFPQRTLCTDDAFRSTRWRSPNESTLTRAHTVAVDGSTKTIWTAGRWLTGIKYCFFSWW